MDKDNKNEKDNEDIHKQTENDTEEEVEQFLSFLGLRDELYHIFISKDINSTEKLFDLDNYEISKTLLDDKKKNLIGLNLKFVMDSIKQYYTPYNSSDKKPSFLSIIREVFYDLDGIHLSKEILINSFKLKSMPNNTLPKHLKHENIKPDKIFASFLQNRNIAFITHLDGFINLKHLYLNNNKIQKIENLNFPSLTILELSHNYIRKIENLDDLVLLQTLNLEKNFISQLENISQNINLDSINLNRQILTKNQIMEINPEGIYTKNIITNLFLEDCNLYDASQLIFFPHLKNLQLANNRIFDLNIFLQCLKPMDNLINLTIKNNPLTELNKHYKDYILIRCGSLEEIDGKTITQNEKQYVNSLYVRKMITKKNSAKNVKENENKYKSKPRVKSTSNLIREESGSLSFLKVKKIAAEGKKHLNSYT